MINAIAKLDISDIHQIGRMTLNEYFLRLEAYQIRKVDTQENLALQAWMNQAVQSTTGSKKHPRPKFKTFGEFYNANSMESKVHKAFNPNYVSPTITKEEKEKDTAEIYLKRYQELQKIRAKQKQNKKNK